MLPIDKSKVVSRDFILNNPADKSIEGAEQYVLNPNAINGVSYTLDKDDEYIMISFSTTSDATKDVKSGRDKKSRPDVAYRNRQSNNKGKYTTKLYIVNFDNGIILNRIVDKIGFTGDIEDKDKLDIERYCNKNYVDGYSGFIRECVSELWSDPTTKFYADCTCYNHAHREDEDTFCKHCRYLVSNYAVRDGIIDKIANVIVTKSGTAKLRNYIEDMVLAEYGNRGEKLDRETVKDVRDALNLPVRGKNYSAVINRTLSKIQDAIKDKEFTLERYKPQNPYTLEQFIERSTVAKYDGEYVFACTVLRGDLTMRGDGDTANTIVVFLKDGANVGKILRNIDYSMPSYTCKNAEDFGQRLISYACNSVTDDTNSYVSIINQILKNIESASVKDFTGSSKYEARKLKEGLEFDTTPEQIYKDCGVLISAMDTDDALALHTNQVADIIERYDSGVEIDDVDGALVQMLMCKLNTVNTVDDVVSTSKEPEDTDYRNGKYADVIVDVDEYPVEYDDVDKEFDSEYDEVCRKCGTSQKRMNNSGRTCGSRPNYASKRPVNKRYACTGMNSRRAECGGEQRSIQYRGERRGGYMR